MELRQSDLVLGPTVGSVLYRLVVTALARASLVLIACMVMGLLSDRGVGPHLMVAGWCFGFVGSFMLGHGLRAERNAMFTEAGQLFASAFLNYVIALAAFLAAGLVAPSAAV